MSQQEEVRCTENVHGKLFAKVDPYSNNWEISCYDCKKSLIKEGLDVRFVMHYYAFDGSYVKTDIYLSDGTMRTTTREDRLSSSDQQPGD